MNPLKVKRADELSLVNGNDSWLIEGLVPRTSLIVLSAPPKHMKSMLALELSVSLCSGEKALRKFKVPQKGRVLYVALEDSESDIAKRVKGLAHFKWTKTTELDLHVVCNQSLLIDTQDGQAQLRAILQDIEPDFVVIDNLARAHRSNENNATKMGAVFDFFQSLKRDFNCTVLVLAHTAKNSKKAGGQNIRGSGQAHSYYETGISLKKNSDGNLLMDLEFRSHPSQEDIPIQFFTSGSIYGLTTGVFNDEDTEELGRE